MEGIIESGTNVALSPQDAINQQFSVICDSLTNFRTQFLTVQQQLRTLEKNENIIKVVLRDMKINNIVCVS